MPRPTNQAASVTTAVSNLIAAVTDLVSGVQGALKDTHVREAAARTKSSAVETTAAVSAKSAKLRKSLKAYWSKMKGKARKERVARMLAGRGLKPKGAKAKRGPGRPASSGKVRGLRGNMTSARKAQIRKGNANFWAKMTPEERAARVAKMRAGRGLAPKAAPTSA